MFGAGTSIEPMTPGLIAFARRSLETSRRVAAPCTGAFVLAEAGLLDGRRATTHWAFARQLQERFPAVGVEEDRIFIVDGSVWTSAGMTAGIDLALAMIEKDHGQDVARSVARKLVVYHRRAGGQSQFSALLELEPKSDRIQRSIDYAKANLRSLLWWRSWRKRSGVAYQRQRATGQAARCLCRYREGSEEDGSNSPRYAPCYKLRLKTPYI
jgi:transcriptional regulator GlxA family with amidase domain